MGFLELFEEKKPIIGMIHLGGGGGEGFRARARLEIGQMYECGLDAVLVEDYFGTAEDVAWTLAYLRDNYPGKIYGVNLLGDFSGSYEAARHYGAAFMQVDSICGHLQPQRDLEYARMIGSLRDGTVSVLGGVRFKYQPVLSGRSVEEDLRLGMERCDAIVVTGAGTGINTELDKIKAFRQVTGSFPLIVGAGLTAETVREQLIYADGAIVGSWFKEEGKAVNPVDPRRLERFMSEVRALRASL